MCEIIPENNVKMLKATILDDVMAFGQPLEETSNLSEKAQIYFLKHMIGTVNNHLTFQDEDLALQLIGIIDQYKNQENEQICEAAFSVDETVSFNVSISTSKRKALVKLNELKAKK